MVTTGRVRHGIVLALAGLLAGLGIVTALYWGGGLPQRDGPEAGSTAPAPAGPASGDAGKGAGRGDAADRGAAGDGAAREGADKGGVGQKGVSEESAGKESGKAAEPADAPRFDIVRIEPNGDAVVAGRGKPNTVVEMLVDGKPVARALADPNGQFAIVPPPLPKGASEIVLRSRTADGQETRSPQSVAVSVSPKGDTRPLVALTSPDAPTVVLSQPGLPETPSAIAGTAGQGTGAGAAQAPSGATEVPARIVSVDAEPGGRLFVTGAGKPGAEVRLYLNDTLIAPGKVGPDGRVTFTIGRGVAGGQYQVRIDEIDPRSGQVRHRAEVPFAMPRQVAEAAAGRPSPRSGQDAVGTGGATPPAASGRAGGPGPAAADATSTAKADGPMAATRQAMPGTGRGLAASGAVFVPEIATARIIRGDSLWQISKRTYGRGERYTVIYDANQTQIRNPDLIYPGQLFVLPNDRRG
ncbi:LysM peptidoglycan-binding domain-containing protein [Methylobacterium sp. J-076]|uniref:LysM peptidoglycan-binding domain-containing protein n=1 Tax=Methylobacterium sp. J-076 TaxID=2836655 RepID=UPI001FB9D1CC|nr:LysM peptidoglycan-binding domain-containing protein [Methylobacterium sp. J-076]MCJ2013201.1 LysM peptidoglycan-binding domain-containing protein [Methylobacterium sp. J-076]